MKKAVHIPPHPRTLSTPRGLHVPSKYAKGHSQPKGAKGHGGGCHGSQKIRANKLAFIATSSQQAKEIANEKSLKQAYAMWRASMTPEQRAVARKLKVLLPAGSDGGENRKPTGGEVQIDFCDPADLPESSIERHPMEDLEPRSDFSVAIESLGSDEITAAADDFSEALTWALDVPDQRDLVGIGMRAMVMIDGLRPELVGEFHRPLNWLAICDGFTNRTSAGFEQHLATGEIFGRVLEWVRRGRTVSEIGERLCLVAYVVRPTMIGTPTLAKLGELMNKTRQSKDKLVTCLRDTFAGLKAAAQRGERTRLVCQNAH